MRKRLLPVLAAAAALGAVIILGRLALEYLRREKTWSIPLAEIDCPPPPGMKRSEFLDEVQYASGLPSDLPLLEEGLPRRLARAFLKHHWVEKVDRVEVIPPASIRVRLTFRTPVLAVPFRGEIRAVDKNGVLLPRDASTKDLPVYAKTPSPPNGSAGAVWADPDLLEAAAKAARTTAAPANRLRQSRK